MTKRDFHFRAENSEPVKKKQKNPEKPAPTLPLNAKRHPSAIPQSSPYDSAPEKEVEKFDVEDEVDITPAVKEEAKEDIQEEKIDEDVKIYTPEKFSPAPKKRGKKGIIIAAVIITIAVGLICVGVCMGLKIF